MKFKCFLLLVLTLAVCSTLPSAGAAQVACGGPSSLACVTSCGSQNAAIYCCAYHMSDADVNQCFEDVNCYYLGAWCGWTPPPANEG